jgi:hypothetical protein
MLHQEVFATSIGILANATAGLTVRLDTKKTPGHMLAVPMLLV